MQKFKPEFGNKEHIAFVEEEEKKQIISEIIEEFPDDFVTREEYDKLKKVFGDALSHIFKTLNKKTSELNDLEEYIDDQIAELNSIHP